MQVPSINLFKSSCNPAPKQNPAGWAAQLSFITSHLSTTFTFRLSHCAYCSAVAQKLLIPPTLPCNLPANTTSRICSTSCMLRPTQRSTRRTPIASIHTSQSIIAGLLLYLRFLNTSSSLAPSPPFHLSSSLLFSLNSAYCIFLALIFGIFVDIQYILHMCALGQ